MQFTDSFATDQRKSVLDCLEFCSLCAKDHYYRPNYHRPDSDLVNHATEYLHQLMNYQEHQSEY